MWEKLLGFHINYQFQVLWMRQKLLWRKSEFISSQFNTYLESPTPHIIAYTLVYTTHVTIFIQKHPQISKFLFHKMLSEDTVYSSSAISVKGVLNHLTRRSENDNTPQPLDQWTNSPFIGQQVGNCKSFTLTHYLADLFAMHRGPRSISLCIQHHIQLTSLSFQVSRPSHS